MLKSLLLILLAICVSVSFGNIIKVMSNDEILLPLHEVSFRNDSSSDITTIIERLDQFKSIENLSIKADDKIWGKFSLERSLSIDNETWFLEFIDSKIDEIDFYRIYPDGKIKHFVAGDNSYNFKDRPILYHKSCFPIQLNNNEPAHFLFSIQNSEHFDLDIKLSPYNQFIESAVTKYHIIGIFFGAVMLIFVILLSHMFIYRQWDLALFLLYLCGLILLFLTYDNFGFHYVWNSYPFVNNKGFDMSMLIYILMQTLFIRKFMDTHFISNKIDSVFVGVMLVRVLIYTISTFVNTPFLTSLSIDLLSLSVLLFGVVNLYIKKHDLARFVIVSLVIQVITLLLVEISEHKLFKNEFTKDFGFQTGMTLALVFYLLAIMDKIRFSNVFFVNNKED